MSSRFTGWQNDNRMGFFPGFRMEIACVCVSKQAEDKPAEENVKHFNDRCYHLIRKVFQDIIQYTVLAWRLADLLTTASWISMRLVHLQEQRHMLTVLQWTLQTLLVPMNCLPTETQPCNYQLEIMFDWNSKCPHHVSWGRGGWRSQTLHHLLCHLP